HDVESSLVAEAGKRDRVILDTGGGVILRGANIEKLKRLGLVFWLTALPETIIARIHDDTNRPALTQGKTFTEEVSEVLSKRISHYQAAADFEIATDSKPVAQIADEIWEYALRHIEI
ncbi:MAG: shikimate kinase, partial [Pseudomonadota bacterium]